MMRRRVFSIGTPLSTERHKDPAGMQYLSKFKMLSVNTMTKTSTACAVGASCRGLECVSREGVAVTASYQG